MGFFDRLFRSPKQSASPNLGIRTVRLPGSSVRVPGRYVDSRDEEGTTILEISRTNDPTIRISILFAESKDKSKPADLANHVRKRAREKGREEEEHLDGKVVDSYEEKSQENGHDLIIRYWIVGQNNCMAIFGVTMLADRLKTPFTQSVLADMSPMIESFKLDVRTEILETLTGPVHTTVTADPNPSRQTTRPFSKDEQLELQSNLVAAQQIREHYASPDAEPLTLRDLDVIFARWLNDQSPNKPSASMIADALGAVFGELIRKTLEMHWQVVSDEYGTAWSLGKTGSTVMTFPVESVRKRTEDRATNFFVPLFQAIQTHAQNEEYNTP